MNKHTNILITEDMQRQEMFVSLRPEILNTLKLLLDRMDTYRKLGLIGGADWHVSTREARTLLAKLEGK